MSDMSEYAVTGTPGAADPREVQPDASQAEELPTIPRTPVHSQTSADPDPAGNADPDADPDATAPDGQPPAPPA